nr:single-stranded DNA-binding protein [Mycoplasmopsis bovis]
MNKVLLVGRIANEIKLITTQNGVNLIKSAIAVRKPNSSSNDAEFIEVIASGTIADFISKNVAKGTLVSLEGNLTSYKFRE